MALVLRRLRALLVLLASVLAVPAVFAEEPPPVDLSVFDGLDAKEVDQATNRQEAKVELALCAPHLAQLKVHPDARAYARSIDDPRCRKAILNAQAAGMTKAEIVDTLMGASELPSDQYTLPHGGPPVVVE